MSLALHSDPVEKTNSSPQAANDFISYQQFRLEVIDGPEAGSVLVASRNEVIIGSDPSADLRIRAEGVAPFHCRILSFEGRISIHDLDSGSGTIVNDIAVQTAHLERAVIIAVGGCRIRFEPISARLHVRRSMATSFDTLVGSSPAMRSLYAELERLIEHEGSVLIMGERSTGKGAVARALHQAGPRRASSFRAVDCTATYDRVEKKLIEAFAHGAGGTLFLDEVGHLPPDLQSRLFRVLVSGDSAIANMYLISSSSVDLRKEVNAGRFSSELYNVLAARLVSMPPVRERSADMKHLVALAVENLQEVDEDARRYFVSPEFLEGLEHHDWPDNMRELEQYLERCITYSRDASALIEVSEEPPAPLPMVDIERPIKAGREEWIKHFERRYLAKMLEAQGGNVTRAAKQAGVDRGHFYRLMFRCGLRQS